MESLFSISNYENFTSLHDFLFTSFSAYTSLMKMYEETTNGNFSNGMQQGQSSSSYYYTTGDDSEYSFMDPDCQKWIFSIIGCILVGLTGVFPLLIIPTVPIPNGNSSKSAQYTVDGRKPIAGIGPKNLKCLLSFAVGSLLGDVFLHLLPEAWATALAAGSTSHDTMTVLGIWTLVGIVSFLICEKLATYEAESDEKESNSNLCASNANNNLKAKPGEKSKTESSQQLLAGYLNLVANGFDNFTHGLAVAGSFIISPRIGFLTTTAILLHEVPHEIGDFAILLRSGFNPWTAAKAQISTATIGLLGAIFTLSVDCMKTVGNYTWWILPFTSGCFINIALTNLLPDLLQEKSPKESMKQLVCLMFGISVMGLVTFMFE